MKKLNLTVPVLGVHVLREEAKDGYNFEQGMKKQEETEGKVQSAAVAEARKQMEEEKLKRDAAMVKSRIQDCDNAVTEAEKNGRFASKHKNIMKEFSENLKKAQAEFESTGDYKTWDKTYRELIDKRDSAIDEAKKEIFNDPYRRVYL